MKIVTYKNTNWFRSTRNIALALLAMVTMAGCPSKKNANQNIVVDPNYHGYQYNGTYCGAVNGCYNQPGYGQMFASALGKIRTTDLNAEIALNFSTNTAVSSFPGPAGYNDNTTIIGTLNVYSSTYGMSFGCQIPPGQYQLYGQGSFGNGQAAYSFTGQIMAGGGYVTINFQNNFLTAIRATSIMGPVFPFAAQNTVTVTSPYGSCGVFVME